VHVEARGDGADTVALAASVSARIKDLVGLSVRMVIEAPGAIERSAGKARRVIDRRGIA